MSVWTVVVAAGGGTRFGGPKQLAPLAGARVLDHAIAAAQASSDGVVVVLAPDGEPVMRTEPTPQLVTTVGGATRSASVRAGLTLVPDDAEIVVVHDAARPGASSALFAAVIAAVRAGADGAVPGLAVADTIKRIDSSGRVVETLAREALVAVQTPQAFRAAVLRAAHASQPEETDDAAAVEQVGATVVVVPGEATAMKITGPADLERLDQLMQREDSP